MAVGETVVAVGREARVVVAATATGEGKWQQRWAGVKWLLSGSVGPAPVPQGHDWQGPRVGQQPGLAGARGLPGSIVQGSHAVPMFSP